MTLVLSVIGSPATDSEAPTPSMIFCASRAGSCADCWPSSGLGAPVPLGDRALGVDADEGVGRVGQHGADALLGGRQFALRAAAFAASSAFGSRVRGAD